MHHQKKYMVNFVKAVPPKTKLSLPAESLCSQYVLLENCHFRLVSSTWYFKGLGEDELSEKKGKPLGDVSYNG